MSDRQLIALDVAGEVRASERACNTAIAVMGTAFSRLPTYEIEAGVCPTVTQRIYVSAVEALDALVVARGKAVEMHKSLAAIGRAHGVRFTRAAGPMDCPPPDTPPDAITSPEMNTGALDPAV